MLSINNFCRNSPDNEKTGYRYTNEEILNAVRVIQLNQKGRDNENAMSRLIKQFYGYIVKCAYAIDAANVDDKIIAGCEGLLYAARNFDLSKGNKFFSYAYNCISGYMKWDFRNSRLVKITSTKLRELRKPENADEFRRLSNPLSLNTDLGKAKNSEDETEHESFISDGIDYEKEAISSAYYEKAAEIMKEIIMQETEEACPGVTYGDIYCHVNELFGYTMMKAQDAADYYGIDVKSIRVKCRRIQQKIYSNYYLRKYLDFKEPRVVSVKIPAVHSDRYGQLLFDLTYPKARAVKAPRKSVVSDSLMFGMSLADYKKDYKLRKEKAEKEQLCFGFEENYSM